MSVGIQDTIIPFGSFPVVEDLNLKGAYQTSASTVDRDAIPAANRKVGMLVYTVATDETYILGPGITNGDWTLVVYGPAYGGAPVNVTKAAADAGVAATVSRSDHKHDITTAAAGTVSIGDAAAEGAASSLSRSDHTHAVTAPGAPVNVTKAAASAGAATTVARSDHKHDIATAAPTTGIGGANSEGTSSSVARADHNHALRTTTGPTDLAIGAITDGEFLKRVGATIVSAAGGSAPLGGTTAARPVTPAQYTNYFDTTLGLPIWYVGVVWVDAAGVTV